MPTIQGKIIKAFEPRQGQNDRGQWMAQDFLLESYDTPYTRKCLFSALGADRLQQFDIKEGDDVAVDVDIDAREYNGRYYNSVRAWRVTHVAAPQMQTAPADGMVPPQAMGGIGMPASPAVASAAPIGAPAPAATTAASPMPAPADPFGGASSSDDLPF